MFETEPDPDWYYTPLWKDLRKVDLLLSEIEKELVSSAATTYNPSLDHITERKINEICRILNNWYYGIFELVILDNDQN